MKLRSLTEDMEDEYVCPRGLVTPGGLLLVDGSGG